LESGWGERPIGRERREPEGESGAVVYIWFSGFGREAGEAEEKWEKPTRSTRIGCRRESDSSDLDCLTRDRTVRNISKVEDITITIKSLKFTVTSA
jgi:hypothetical protein